MDNAPAQMHARAKDQRKLLLVAVAGVERRRSNNLAGMIGTSNKVERVRIARIYGTK